MASDNRVLISLIEGYQQDLLSASGDREVLQEAVQKFVKQLALSYPDLATEASISSISPQSISNPRYVESLVLFFKRIKELAKAEDITEPSADETRETFEHSNLPSHELLEAMMQAKEEHDQRQEERRKQKKHLRDWRERIKEYNRAVMAGLTDNPAIDPDNLPEKYKQFVPAARAIVATAQVDSKATKPKRPEEHRSRALEILKEVQRTQMIAAGISPETNAQLINAVAAIYAAESISPTPFEVDLEHSSQQISQINQIVLQQVPSSELNKLQVLSGIKGEGTPLPGLSQAQLSSLPVFTERITAPVTVLSDHLVEYHREHQALVSQKKYLSESDFIHRVASLKSHYGQQFVAFGLSYETTDRLLSRVANISAAYPSAVEKIEPLQKPLAEPLRPGEPATIVSGPLAAGPGQRVFAAFTSPLKKAYSLLPQRFRSFITALSEKSGLSRFVVGFRVYFTRFVFPISTQIVSFATPSLKNAAARGGNSFIQSIFSLRNKADGVQNFLRKIGSRLSNIKTLALSRVEIIIVVVLGVLLIFGQSLGLLTPHNTIRRSAFTEQPKGGGAYEPVIPGEPGFDDGTGSGTDPGTIIGIGGTPPIFVIEDAVCPVNGGYVTQCPGGGFSHNSSYPLARYAFDISIGAGSPVMATHAGVVATIKCCFAPGTGTSFGNYVLLRGITDSGATFYTIYAHLLKIADAAYRSAENGKVIQPGEVIGFVDTTGASTGNHLHYGYSGPNQAGFTLPLGCAGWPNYSGNAQGCAQIAP